VEILDCGCGYGGLLSTFDNNIGLVKLADFDSDTLMLGMEIRPKVVNFVAEKIRALRFKAEHKKVYYSYIYFSSTTLPLSERT